MAPELATDPPVVRHVRLDDAIARPLLAGLTRAYTATYGEVITSAEMAAREAEEFTPPRGALLMLEEGSIAVAGGGLVRSAHGIAEIKRMWTAPGHRRRGHGRRVLTALEDEARALGYSSVRLATGERSAAALALYRSAGYRAIPAFGRYRDEPLARAFAKTLLRLRGAHPKIGVAPMTPSRRPELTVVGSMQIARYRDELEVGITCSPSSQGHAPPPR
jgi:ribosomal protein S18 acetylase RimI-like enzyme